MKERHAHEVQAGQRRNGAALLLGIPVLLLRQREPDPAIVVAEAGAPDDIRDVQHAPVGQHGLPALDSDRPLEDELHARGLEIRALHADERAAVHAKLMLRLATHRCRHGQDPRPQEAQHGPGHAHAPAVERDWNLAGIPAGENGRVPRARNLERDVASRVRRADHEHPSRLQLLRALVVGGVELPNRRIQLGRELGRDRVLVLEHTRRDDHVVRAEPTIACASR